MHTENIKCSLNTKILGSELQYFDIVESTNKLLYEFAEKGTQEGTVIISDMQTGGKGRLGRSWYSPKGVNLYLSVLLSPQVKPENSAVFTFIASLALTKTLDEVGIHSEIKWPNDILIKNKKVAGVLTEMNTDGEFINFIVIGIGLNINLTEESIKKNLPEIAESVTSISIEKGKVLSREKVCSILINYLDEYYLQFKLQGINSIVAEWSNRWGKINERVSIKIEDKVVSGIARKVDTKGFLYVEEDNGNLEKIIAGDIQG